jgi:prepilin-type processing-associated H-X9-DG protein
VPLVLTPVTFRTVLRACVGWLLAMAVAGPVAAAPPGPTPAHFFPRNDLVLYAEFDGLDNHAESWRHTAAYRLLTETTTGAMLGDLASQLGDRTLPGSGMRALTTAEVRALVTHAMRHGFAFGVVHKPGQPEASCVGVVIRGGGRAEIRAIVEKLVSAGKRPDETPQTLDRPKGRKMAVLDLGQSRSVWWVEGDDLALSLISADGADLMIGALDGSLPDATGHPEIAALRRSVDGFMPIGLAFVDTSRLAGSSAQATLFGLDHTRRIEYRWGFQDDAVMTSVRVVADAPRAGLLSVLDQPSFGRGKLPPLPGGIAGFGALSVDLPGLHDRVAAGFSAIGPAAGAWFETFGTSFRTTTGVRLRDDILPLLGPDITFYTLPDRDVAPVGITAVLTRGLLAPPRPVVRIAVKDTTAFARILDEAMTAMNSALKARADETSRPPPVRIRPLAGVAHGYVLSVSPGAFPLPAGTRPTMVLGKRSLIMAGHPADAQEALAIEERGDVLPAADPLAPSLARIPDRAIFVSVSDPKRSFLPDLVANLPMLVEWGSKALNQGLMQRFMPGRQVVRFGPQGQPIAAESRRMTVEIDPDRVPAPEDLRPFLFPSVFVITADDQGVQLTTREAFPVLNPAAMAPVAVALLWPAIQASRAATLRTQSVTNLKRIGLAMHNYLATNNTFPPQFITGKQGKPLLSWRVALLPFLEEQELYNQFKLDEPWDSPHNKPLAARMPNVFAIPGARAEPGKTFYRGFSGAGAFFDPKVKGGVDLATVTDGTSNTIGIIEARTAVPWTKPDEEIPFNPAVNARDMADLPKALGNHFPGGFNVLFLDGSVRFIKTTINPNILRALITRNGGEVISVDSF